MRTEGILTTYLEMLFVVLERNTVVDSKTLYKFSRLLNLAPMKARRDNLREGCVYNNRAGCAGRKRSRWWYFDFA